MIRFYTLNAYYMRHIAYMIFKNCCTHLKDRTLYCLIAVETTGRVAVLHVPKYEVKYLQNHANWNFPQTKFSNMKLKLPRLIRLKFLSKFSTNWKFGFLQSFFNLKFQQLWLFFESIQNKLSRLDLTFFQLFYDGLFKQSFPSRNPKIPKFWVVKFWISKLRYES